MTAARLALRAPALLRALNEQGVLDASDVHVAARLGGLGGETDETVLLAAALAVRGTRQGSVVLRLREVPSSVTGEQGEALDWPEAAAWERALLASPLVAVDDDQRGRPLRWSDGGLWLARSWRQERQVAQALLERSGRGPDVDTARLQGALARLWPGAGPADQRRAAEVCVLSRSAVLVGGPGTGKTTTVARVLLALREVAGTPPLVALAAPTGKAAARLQEAVQRAAGTPAGPDDPVLDADERAFLQGLTAGTLHRLLGVRRGSSRARHGPDDRLPHDVVVVDEASMVSLGLFARLLDALRPGARLLLVGDPDQLASVEAGAVLADLVGPDGPAPAAGGAPSAVRAGVVRLTTVHRFDEGGAIAALAAAVRDGDAERAVGVLRRGDPAVVFDEGADDAPVEGAALAALRARVLDQAAQLVRLASEEADAERAAGELRALRVLDDHRLLCAHRAGPRGAETWTRTVQRWVVRELGVVPRADGRYPGLPLLVTQNDPDNRLVNGDSGVVVRRGDALAAVFARGDGVHEVPLSRLAQVVPLHALTVHRSQGSQFAHVTLLLPAATSPLLTRQTLYTAVTRAARSVRVVGSEQAVRQAVQRTAARATGLRERLA